MRKRLCNIEKRIIVNDYDELSTTIQTVEIDEVTQKISYDNMKLVEIDELLIPTIFLLNRKGYITEFCCSGHIDEPYGGYVAFKEPIFQNIPTKEVFEKAKSNYIWLKIDDKSDFKNRIIRAKDPRSDYNKKVSYNDALIAINGFCGEMFDFATKLPYK